LAGLSQPFTLIRKRNSILLRRTDQPIPYELIDQVDPADLDQRGLFEIMRVLFDLGELDGEVIYDDLRKQVSDQKYFHYFEASNQIQH